MLAAAALPLAGFDGSERQLHVIDLGICPSDFTFSASFCTVDNRPTSDALLLLPMIRQLTHSTLSRDSVSHSAETLDLRLIWSIQARYCLLNDYGHDTHTQLLLGRFCNVHVDQLL